VCSKSERIEKIDVDWDLDGGVLVELVDKYYVEDGICKSDLYDMINEYRKLLGLTYEEIE